MAGLHGADVAPSAQRHDPGQPPEPGGSMSATGEAFAREQVPHLPSAVGFPRLLMQDAHARDRGLIGLFAWIREPVLPSIEAASTHL